MKKVEKVSIAEISFTLDNDAYDALKQYLDSLHDCYDEDPDGREIIADIEARIAELILSEQVYTKIVSKTLVDTIIAQLGTPDQIDVEADEEGGESRDNGFQGMAGGAAGHAGSVGSGSSFDTPIPRRLHRSNEGRVLGGVCSGLAKYLDISVIFVRIVFLLPAIISLFVRPFVHIVFHGPFDWYWRSRDLLWGWFWVFVFIYIVLWIALPMARTPRQKLEARGEKITSASIRQNFQESAKTPAGKKAASVMAELVTVVGRVLLFIVKFVTTVIGFLLLFAAIGIFMGMIVALINPESFIILNGMNIFSIFEGMSIISPVLFVALMLLCVILPLAVVGMALLSFTFNWRLGRMFYGLTLGAWAIAMIFCGIVAAGNVRFFRDKMPFRLERWENGNRIWHDGRWHEWQNGKWNGWMTVKEMRDAFENGEIENLVEWKRDTMVVVFKNRQDTVKIPQHRASIFIDLDGFNSSSYKDSITNRIKIRRIE